MLERRVLGGRVNALLWRGEGADGFTVAFTERHAGRSQGPYDSLNLSAETGDRWETVLGNRRMVSEALEVEAFALGQQVHRAGQAEVGSSEAGSGFDDPEGGLAGSDVLTTKERGVAVGVLVADCVPVALVSPGEGRVSVVHAGWRGIAAGVIQAALSAFDRAGEIRAVIGAAVGPDHYEIGRDAAEAVDGAGEGAAIARTGGRLSLDLAATVEAYLRHGGVFRIDRAEGCTACLPDHFFSHRRDGITGRQALIAVRR